MLWNFRNRGACRRYIARLEALADVRRQTPDSGSSALMGDADFSRHMEQCAGCRQALESAMIAGRLLRELRPPETGPDSFFAARVTARIRAVEQGRLASSEFWVPIEKLSRKLVWTSAILLVVLSSLAYEMKPGGGTTMRAQETVSDRFPEPLPHPPDEDEILVSLAERAR